MNSIFNKLVSSADILAADATTVLLPGVAAGFEELSGRALELAQLHNSETTVRVTVCWNVAIVSSCYVRFEGVPYPVDYVRDPGVPNPDVKLGQVRRGMLLELYAHRLNDWVGAFSSGLLLENGTDLLTLEDAVSFLQLET